MTTINCSSKCVFQRDGKCELDSITSLPMSSNPDCSYFQPVISSKTEIEIKL